jgi:hypothetical protein
VPFQVTHAFGTTTVRVDQRAAGTPDPRGGNWARLGVFAFDSGAGAKVELNDNANGYVVADAVRLRRF